VSVAEVFGVRVRRGVHVVDKARGLGGVELRNVALADVGPALLLVVLAELGRVDAPPVLEGDSALEIGVVGHGRLVVPIHDSWLFIIPSLD